MPRAPAPCKLSGTSAATSVSPSRRSSWSCRHAASSSWASPWTPLFGRCASRRTDLHGFAIACPRGGRGGNAPRGSCCRGSGCFPSRAWHARRLIDLSMTVPALAHRIILPAAARADITWWVEFLPSWNGRAFFPPPPVAAAALRIATDASGVGLGAAFDLIWLTRRAPPPPPPPPPRLPRLSCHCPGVVAVAVAVHCWGEECHVTQILLHTANMPVVPVLTPGTCTCPHLSLVRRVFFFPCPAERAFASGARAGLPGY